MEQVTLLVRQTSTAVVPAAFFRAVHSSASPPTEEGGNLEKTTAKIKKTIEKFHPAGTHKQEGD